MITGSLVGRITLGRFGDAAQVERDQGNLHVGLRHRPEQVPGRTDELLLVVVDAHQVKYE